MKEKEILVWINIPTIIELLKSTQVQAIKDNIRINMRSDEVYMYIEKCGDVKKYEEALADCIVSLNKLDNVLQSEMRITRVHF